MIDTRPRSAAFSATLLLLLIVLVFGYGAILRPTFTNAYRGANDFYIPWRATQGLLWEGLNPYGLEVTGEIQQTLFGQPRAPGEHQFDFAYPLTLAPLLAPYTLFSYEWAQPLWQATVHLFLVGSVVLWLRSWRPVLPRPLLLAGLILWTLSLYPAARAFILGQIAVLVLAAIAVAFWGLSQQRDFLAGVALAVATVKPQLSFLVVPALLFLALTSGRRQVLWGFGTACVALLGSSLFLMPNWPLAFLGRLAEYQRYTSLGAASDSPSPVELIAHQFGPAAPWLGTTLALVLLIPLLRQLWEQRQAPNWTELGVALLVVSAWITPRAATTDQVLLILPLIYLLTRRPRLTAGIIAVSLWVGLWLLFILTVQGDQEQLVVRLPLPLAVLALWLCDRRSLSLSPQTSQDRAPSSLRTSTSPNGVKGNRHNNMSPSVDTEPANGETSGDSELGSRVEAN